MVKSESEAINEVKVGHQQFLPLALTNKPFRGNFRQHLKLFSPPEESHPSAKHTLHCPLVTVHINNRLWDNSKEMHCLCLLRDECYSAFLSRLKKHGLIC